MPVYEYSCGCGHKFESFRKIDNRSDPTNEPCPSCDVVGKVSIGISAPNISYTAGNQRVNTDSKLREKFQQIHENTHGSTLDKLSTITKI